MIKNLKNINRGETFKLLNCNGFSYIWRIWIAFLYFVFCCCFNFLSQHLLMVCFVLRPFSYVKMLFHFDLSDFIVSTLAMFCLLLVFPIDLGELSNCNDCRSLLSVSYFVSSFWWMTDTWLFKTDHLFSSVKCL